MSATPKVRTHSVRVPVGARRAEALAGAAEIIAALKTIDPDLRLDAFALAIDAWVRHPEVLERQPCGTPERSGT